MNRSLQVAAGLGAVAGLRGFQSLAWVARDLSRRRRPRRASRLERVFADDRVAAGLAIMAAAELAGDKLPGVPDRVAPFPLAGRALAGAVAGALAVGRDRAAAGAALGAASAVATAWVAWLARRELARATLLPDFAIAAAEDAIAVAAARELVTA